MMVDTFRYDETYWVHDVDEDPTTGDSYSDLEDAIFAAKDDAIQDCANKDITHVLSRVVRNVIVDIRVEEV